MAEVRFASAAFDLGPGHSVVRICLGLHGFLTRRSIKARPPGARVVFGFRTKQRLATADAFVSPRCIRILVLAGKGRLSPLLPGHMVLILRELFLPSGVVFAYFFTHDFYQSSSGMACAFHYLIQRSASAFQPGGRIARVCSDCSSKAGMPEEADSQHPHKRQSRRAKV